MEKAINETSMKLASAWIFDSFMDTTTYFMDKKPSSDIRISVCLT